MTEQPLQNLESLLTSAGSDFPFPPTPEITRAVRARLQAEHHPQPLPARRLRFALVAGLILFLLLSSLVIPPVRAQILEFIQIGIIRILLVEPTPTPSPVPATPINPGVFPAQTKPALPSGTPQPSLTPRPSPTPLPSLLDLQGETDLDQAQRRFDFPVRLPAYPADLGPPDRVFLQDLNGQMLVLVWLDPQQPNQIKLSLHEYAGKDNLSGVKTQPVQVDTTTVNGQPAIWAVGPYLLKLSNGNYDLVRLIEGHVLIWQEGEVTYRLETDLPLEEAVRIAESLRPLDEIPPD